MSKSKPVITDVDTLKELVSKSAPSWWHKTLIGLLAANFTLMVTISWGLINDHFTLKSLAITAEIHTKQLGNLSDRVVSGEKKDTATDVRLDNLEKQRVR